MPVRITFFALIWLIRFSQCCFFNIGILFSPNTIRLYFFTVLKASEKETEEDSCFGYCLTIMPTVLLRNVGCCVQIKVQALLVFH